MPATNQRRGRPLFLGAGRVFTTATPPADMGTTSISIRPTILSAYVDGRDDESCNVYNMLKMTRELFALHPEDPRYAAYQERALFNHVLGSMDPEDGRTCYMVPVGAEVTHEYQDMFNSFTCCVGTGMENHALNGYGIYDETGDKLWVNLYTPSIAQWKSQGATIETRTDFPEGEHASITVTLPSAKRLTLALRRPLWAGEGFSALVNGKAVRPFPAPGNYVEVSRRWKSGDHVAPRAMWSLGRRSASFAGWCRRAASPLPP